MTELLFGCPVDPSLKSDNGFPTRILQSEAGEVYVNAPAIRRVKNTLDVLTSCTNAIEFRSTREGNDRSRDVSISLSFREIFKIIHPGSAEQYEILRIVRVLNDDEYAARFWFEYISKDGLEASDVEGE